MKNPLHKRLPREFLGEFGKYAAIFLFMAGTIAFVSGFLVAVRSLQIEYDASFERYDIEDGHFVLDDEPEQKILDLMEQEEITLVPDYYIEETAAWGDDAQNQTTLRLFGDRSELNRVCLLEGKMPEQEHEVALDRAYMNNNKLQMKDTIQIADGEYQICGIVALSDYSVLCQNNNDIMFDATKFGVGVVTNQCFAEFGQSNLFYSYAWKYDRKPKNDTEEKEVSDDLGEALAGYAANAGLKLETFLPQYINKSIQFAGDDMGSDRPMMICLLYILIAIMAFVFAVTINHTMVREAAVIGTLRASGYTKGEILRHYLTMPMLVAFLAAAVGNILGYTVFVKVAADMYLNSYSLTTFHAYFNADAFIKTTVVPMLIMLLVTGISLWKKLSFSPLQFLRRDLTRSKRKKAVRLPHFKFFNRFRLRIIIQNASSYATLFVGILFASLILMFGMIMTPLLQGYSDDALQYKPADYQYILKSAKELDEDVAEKYCVTSLKMQDDYYDEEDISVYGIVENSRYYDIDLPEEGVVITSDMSKKYGLQKGDIINLREEYGKGIYAFRIEGIYEYPTCLGVFMKQKYYCRVFEQDIIEQTGAMGWFQKAFNEVSGAEGDSYFNGYFSDEDLRGTHLSDDDIASVITDDDLTKLSRQMDRSMGAMFGMIKVFAIVLFILLIYLLTKLILEKNSVSISMVKILGYQDREVAGLYLVASVWVVLVSAVLSMVINTWLFHFILIVFLKGYGGWFNLKVTPELYALMFLMMAFTYLLVAAAQFFKIRRIPMDEALKNVE